MSRRHAMQNRKCDALQFFTLLFADSSNGSIEIRAIDDTRHVQVHFDSGRDDFDDLTYPANFPKWITIPIRDIDGNFLSFKLRQDSARGDNKMTYPAGVQAQSYDWQTLQNVTEKIVICEGGEIERY